VESRVVKQGGSPKTCRTAVVSVVFADLRLPSIACTLLMSLYVSYYYSLQLLIDIAPLITLNMLFSCYSTHLNHDHPILFRQMMID
jgi:hypothetical protein